MGAIKIIQNVINLTLPPKIHWRMCRRHIANDDGVFGFAE